MASEAWESSPVNLLKIYATYKEARAKLAVAEDKSDLNTTDPEDCGRGKRKKFRKRISSSETEAEDDQNLCNLIKVPKFQPSDNYLGASQKSSERLLQLQEPPTFSKNVPINPDTNQAPDSDVFTVTTENDYGGDINLVPLTYDGSFTLSSEKSSEDICISGFETTVLREISILKFKVNTLMEKLDTVINYINRQQNDENIDHKLAKDFKNLIPVKNFSELQKLEDKLKDENVSNQMMHFLGKVGGHSREQATKLMLKKVMTDDMAALFSYLGIRDKRPFKSLEICKVILCAVRTHVSWSEASETDIEKTISNWLRHAKARYQSKLKPKLKPK